MGKYFIFQIKEEYFNVYKNNPVALYKILENLYFLENMNFNYGISIYNQLCKPFDVNVISSYYNQYKSILNKYVLYNDKSIFEINNTCLVVLSNSKLPEKIKKLHYYSRTLFVCEFKKQEYFWLEEDKVYQMHNYT